MSDSKEDETVGNSAEAESAGSPAVSAQAAEVEASTDASEAAPAANEASEEIAAAAKSEEIAEEAKSDEPKVEAKSDAPKAAPAKPKGPKRHLVRGGIILALGLIPLFVIMAMEGQIPRGPLWGILANFVVALGILDLLGLFTPSDEELSLARPWRETWLGPLVSGAIDAKTSPYRGEASAATARIGEPFFLAPVVTLPVGFAIACIGAIFGTWEALPWVLIAALAIQLPAAIRRPGLLVFVFAAAIILPFLGAFGLVDPWETHYGEVAREILTRDDWISLWWAHEEWFFSKPIFIFWSEALSMGALGVHYLPDQMLTPTPALAHPEWAVRFPHFLLSTSAICAVYVSISRAFGKRAGALAAMVLVTMPHYFMLSHQAITDMPFVSTMTIAMCFMILAISEDKERLARGVRIGNVVLTVKHLVLGGLVVLVLPQALYLMTRNVTLVEGGFAWHRDMFWFGSGGGNAGNPGQPELREVAPAFEGFAAQPFTQGVYWLTGLFVLLFSMRKERRAQPFAMLGFYIFAALSFMAKGIPGFALPGLIALFFLLGSKRWSLLLDGTFRVAQGILVILVVAMPWYVAMYMRHGNAFTDRLLIHDHINRLTAGVHGDTGSVQYFFEQQGFGLFPWVALAPLAIGAWAFYQRRKDSSAQDMVKADVAMLVGLWGTSAFVLFSAMTTKFHHYIFPAVPPAGILVGLAIEPLWAQVTTNFKKQAIGTALAFVAPIPGVLGVGGLWGNLRGIAPADIVAGAPLRDWVTQHPENATFCYLGIALSIVLIGLAWRVLQPAAGETFAVSEASPVPSATVFGMPALPAASVGLVASLAIVGFVGRDLAWVTSEAHPFGFERLIHLFSYNYERTWPEQLDYRPILTGFAVTAGVSIGIATIATFRATAMRALLGTSFFFAIWCLDVYMGDLGPHWGQRGLFERYYENRVSADERLVAWQLNWKGENFYTGNACYIFEDLDTRELVAWAGEHQGERHFFVIDPSRVGALRSTLRGTEVVRETTIRENNHFMIVSVTIGLAGEAARAYREAHHIPQPTAEQLQ